jgi:DNA polymerase-4
MSIAGILHVDLDAFYASVEQLLNPELRDIPMAVSGGAILACSYEAKAYGISAGMAESTALRKCPNLAIVPGHFEEYSKLSDAVFAICRDFTPELEQISIDEAFLDVTGSVHIFGSPGEIARQLRVRVREEVELNISAGVATTKFLAKIASQVAKPDGLIVVEPGAELAFMHPLPVSLMWGVGPVTEKKLSELGVRTIGELAALPRPTANTRLGVGAGDHLWALAHNEDSRPVTRSRRAKSIGAQSAFGAKDQSWERFSEVLLKLSDRVASRLRAKDRAGRTVTVRVRFAGMTSVTRSHTVRQPIATTAAIHQLAMELARDGTEMRDERVNLLGVSVSNVEVAPAIQLELGFEAGDVTNAGSTASDARTQLEASIDDLRSRFGSAAVGSATTVLGDHEYTTDAFRELVEKKEEVLESVDGDEFTREPVIEDGSDSE